VFEQAAGLALIAACYPTVILIASLYLASSSPGRITASFVLGGLLAATVVGTAALIAIRAGGLSLPSHHTTRYGLRLVLGIVAIVAAVIIFRRKPKPPDPAKVKKPSRMARLTADPKPRSAFAVGAMIFAFSGTFLAAVQVVATAKASVGATIAAMAMIIAMALLLAWVPLVAYLIAPEPTTKTLQGFNHWLTRHGRTLLAAAVGVIGVILVAQGAAGIA
jgi:MFS family permease